MKYAISTLICYDRCSLFTTPFIKYKPECNRLVTSIKVYILSILIYLGNDSVPTLLIAQVK